MANFRKRIKILPGVNLNVSKSGFSTTIGPKGANVNIGKKGAFLNTGIPGTGIYSRKKISSNTSSQKNPIQFSTVNENSELVTFYVKYNCTRTELQEIIANESIPPHVIATGNMEKPTKSQNGCLWAVVISILFFLFFLILSGS